MRALCGEKSFFSHRYSPLILHYFLTNPRPGCGFKYIRSHCGVLSSPGLVLNISIRWKHRQATNCVLLLLKTFDLSELNINLGRAISSSDAHSVKRASISPSATIQLGYWFKTNSRIFELPNLFETSFQQFIIFSITQNPPDMGMIPKFCK